jgi:chemotaxis protein histidine kinase CheA
VSPADDSSALDPQSLFEYFAGRLPDRLREIDDGWRRVQETAWSEDAVRTLHRLAHSLTGAGATFGFTAITDAGRALERRLRAVLHGEPPLDPAMVESLLAALRHAASQPPPEKPPAS